MRSPNHSTQFAFSLAVFALTAIVGCSQPVQEDRRIEFNQSGAKVSFQNGDDIYVANKDGVGLTKIYTAEKDVLATSRPQSSPTDDSVIFTTATAAERTDYRRPATGLPLLADGRVATQIPIQMTCWRVENASPQTDEPPPVPTKLFTATCDHVGYVLADLAVRWHPNGRSIFYVNQIDGTSEHSLFEFDLATKKQRRVFPKSAQALIFDWSPNGSWLGCVLGNVTADATSVNDMGIWVGTPGVERSWWLVPDSSQFANSRLPSLLERLRVSRPVWKPDASEFAFVGSAPTNSSKSVASRLSLANVKRHSVENLFETEGYVRDLAWTPDGNRLAFLAKSPGMEATLQIMNPDKAISELPTAKRLRRFAGFDTSGERIAYVAAPSNVRPATRWPLLLRADSRANDAVWAATSVGENPVEVFSGPRVTFPSWSPTEKRLSLWLTFSPRFRSIFGLLQGWGLWPGDPAAAIDLETKAVDWMAVSPQEELQIGHIHLMRGDPSEAWNWYSKARQKLPTASTPGNWQQLFQQLSAPENSLLFEFICLTRLHRDGEAAQKLSEWKTLFQPLLAAKVNGEEWSDDANMPIARSELLRRLLLDLHVAEVFMSVEAGDEAIAFLKSDDMSRTTSEAQLSRDIAIGQVLLAIGDHDGYVTLCARELVPSAVPVLNHYDSLSPNDAAALSGLPHIACGMALAPLFHHKFVATLPEPTVGELQVKLEELTAEVTSSRATIGPLLMLRACAVATGDQTKVNNYDKQVLAHAFWRQLAQTDNIDGSIDGWFPDPQSREDEP